MPVIDGRRPATAQRCIIWPTYTFWSSDYWWFRRRSPYLLTGLFLCSGQLHRSFCVLIEAIYMKEKIGVDLFVLPFFSQ